MSQVTAATCSSPRIRPPALSPVDAVLDQLTVALNRHRAARQGAALEVPMVVWSSLSRIRMAGDGSTPVPCDHLRRRQRLIRHLWRGEGMVQFRLQPIACRHPHQLVPCRAGSGRECLRFHRNRHRLHWPTRSLSMRHPSGRASWSSEARCSTSHLACVQYKQECTRGKRAPPRPVTSVGPSLTGVAVIPPCRCPLPDPLKGETPSCLIRVRKVQMAERQGFEPWRRFPAYTRSRRAPSTTRPPLRRMLLSRFSAWHASADEEARIGPFQNIRHQGNRHVAGIGPSRWFRASVQRSQAGQAAHSPNFREPETRITPPQPRGSQRGRKGPQKRSSGQGSRCR